MQKIAKYGLLGFLTMLWVPAFAQAVEMADVMRSSGKIYVIVGIVLIILLGLIGYLVYLDRKISRLEKELRNS